MSALKRAQNMHMYVPNLTTLLQKRHFSFFFPVFSCRCQLLFFDLAEDLIGRNDTVFNYGVKEQTLNETEDIKVLYTLFTITHTHTHNIYACTI